LQPEKKFYFSKIVHIQMERVMHMDTHSTISTPLEHEIDYYLTRVTELQNQIEEYEAVLLKLLKQQRLQAESERTVP
jgi:hypothetical protein